MEVESICPVSIWKRDSVRVDDKYIRVTAPSGEFLVLGSCQRRKGAHRWEVFVRKKTPGTRLSVGIAAGIEESELALGAQDTAFHDRIWHYCNSDGTLRNAARQVPSVDQASCVPYGTGDKIEIFLDIERGEIKFAKNSKPVDGIIRNVKDEKFLQAQKEAKVSKNPFDDGFGRFMLVLSLSPGDFVEVEESPYGLTYSAEEPTYPWHMQIIPNQPRLLAGSIPIKFSINRKLPDGLELDESTGMITGTPSGKKELDMNGWRDLCFQMYNGKLGEQGWEKARASLIKSLGTDLSNEELRIHARELFDRFDSDGSGEIEFEELKVAIDYLQVKVSDEELLHMAAELDVDGDAQIGFAEFENMLLRMYYKKPKRSQKRKQASLALKRTLGTDLVGGDLHTKCRQMFKQFDEDHSGRIDMSELMDALQAFGVTDITDRDLIVMIDELGIDQGVGDEEGLDFPNFSKLVTSLYTDSATEENVWERAKAGLVRLLGQNLKDGELWDRTDAVFYELDEDKSGVLDISELDVAMKKIGVHATDDELSRMIEEADVSGRLWVIAASNRWGSVNCFLKITVLEGVSELQYASMDTFSRVGDKFPPLKVARIKGAVPFTYESIVPVLPEGMALDHSTGAISGRPLQESSKTLYTVTVKNAVSSATGQFYLQTLIEPSDLRYEYSNCIYKEGKLRFPGWAAARRGMLAQLGEDINDDKIEEMATKMFSAMDSDGSGAVSIQELKAAFSNWNVVVPDEDLQKMVLDSQTQPIMQAFESDSNVAVTEGDREAELDLQHFLEIVKQTYSGFKAGTDRFKSEANEEWADRENKIASIKGTGPFVFRISPELPEGLSIDVKSGTIEGVPLHEAYGALYTVRVSNRVGETTTQLTIEVLEPPSELQYVLREHMLSTIHEIRPIRCSVRGTKTAKCGKMNFRAGRDPTQARQIFDEYDKDQSGFLDPEEFQKMLYQIGVVFDDAEFKELLSKIGEDSQQVTFQDFWQYFRIGLPKGLKIDYLDGTITGVPACPCLPGIYTITCSNAVGEIATSIKIEVQEAPSQLQYMCLDALYKVGCPIGFCRLPAEVIKNTLSELGQQFESNSLTWRGSKVRFSCNPPLPDGLQLDPGTGCISGMPSAVTMKKGKPGLTAPKIFVITGQNQVASASTEILIEVSKAPSILKYKRMESVYGIGEEIRDNEVVLCDGAVPYFFTVTRDPDFTRNCFDKYDTDHSGSLDVEEFKKFIRDLGEKLNEAEFRWLVSQIDSDKSGTVEYNEFWEWWKPLPYGLELEEATGTIFGRPLRRCENTVFIATVWNKVGSHSVPIKIHVLDETMSRDRDADTRRQFWYTGRRTMSYPNGDKYEGEWENGKFQGFGIFTGANNSKYEGQWRRGKRHGVGKEMFPDGMNYEGEYVDNFRHGTGILRWPSGATYSGQFEDGKRAGRGTQVWNDDNGKVFTYDGMWVGDDMHGAGIVSEGGESYAVEARCGSIVFRYQPQRDLISIGYSDGSSYDGDAKRSSGTEMLLHSAGPMDVPHGFGRRIWPSGDGYEGEYKHGQRDGHGRFLWADGNAYEGQWKGGQPWGSGVLVQEGLSSVVWYGDDGKLEFEAPAARIPVSVLDEQTLGLSRMGKMLTFPRARARSPADIGRFGSSETEMALPALFPSYSCSILSGCKDGTDFGMCYTDTAKKMNILPELVASKAGSRASSKGGSKAAGNSSESGPVPTIGSAAPYIRRRR